MTALAFDPTRDRSYERAKLARDVADWLAWLELGGTAARTLDQYERDLARGCLLFPDVALEDWTDSELLHVMRRFKTKERRVRMAAWRSFFKWARQTKRITENPMETLPVIKQPKPKVIDVFSDAEVEALLSLDVVDAAPLAILFEAGLRKAEARALTLRRCSPESNRVVVVAGKGNRDRVIPMSPRLRKLLADLALIEGLSATDQIFYRVHANDVSSKRKRDKPVGEGTFARWWARCIEQAGVRYRTPHTARHTFATRLYQKGMRTEEIQVLMGHASPSTTSDIYVHVRAEDVFARFQELQEV